MGLFLVLEVVSQKPVLSAGVHYWRLSDWDCRKPETVPISLQWSWGGGDDLFFPKSPPPSLVRKPEWRVSLWHYKLHLSDSRHSGKSSQSCCRDDLRLYGENNFWNYTFAYFPHGLWSSQGSRVERVWQLKINKSRTKSLIDQSQEVNQELNKRIRIHTFRFTLSIGWPGWLFRERMGATDFCIPELVWV